MADLRRAGAAGHRALSERERSAHTVRRFRRELLLISLARIIHELSAADVDSSENTGRAPFACSTCCTARLRALQSAPPSLFTTLGALATTLHE